MITFTTPLDQVKPISTEEALEERTKILEVTSKLRQVKNEEEYHIASALAPRIREFMGRLTRSQIECIAQIMRLRTALLNEEFLFRQPLRAEQVRLNSMCQRWRGKTVAERSKRRIINELMAVVLPEVPATPEYVAPKAPPKALEKIWTDPAPPLKFARYSQSRDRVYLARKLAKMKMQEAGIDNPPGNEHPDAEPVAEVVPEPVKPKKTRWGIEVTNAELIAQTNPELLGANGPNVSAILDYIAGNTVDDEYMGPVQGLKVWKL